MSYNDRQYQSMAKAIISDFSEKRCALDAGVVKVAQDLSLNANETRRLVEATNVHAHLELFEKMAEHRYVEFDVVDPTGVLDCLFASPATVDKNSPLEKTAAVLFTELPDERWDQVRERVQKVASEAVPHVEEPQQEKVAARHVMAAADKVAKTTDELETRLHEAYLNYNDKVAALREQFRYTDAIEFDEFARDAYGLLGKHAEHTIEKLRELMRLPQEKTAEAWENPTEFVIERREHALFKEAVAAYQTACDVGRGLEWHNQYTRGLQLDA
jgi:hypothetical protein